MEGARSYGYTIPEDLSIIGYDDLYLCNYTFPKLSSVSQNVTEKAKIATRLLLERITFGHKKETAKQTMDVSLIVRDSVVDKT